MFVVASSDNQLNITALLKVKQIHSQVVWIKKRRNQINTDAYCNVILIFWSSHYWNIFAITLSKSQSNINHIHVRIIYIQCDNLWLYSKMYECLRNNYKILFYPSQQIAIETINKNVLLHYNQQGLPLCFSRHCTFSFFVFAFSWHILLLVPGSCCFVTFRGLSASNDIFDLSTFGDKWYFDTIHKTWHATGWWQISQQMGTCPVTWVSKPSHIEILYL